MENQNAYLCCTYKFVALKQHLEHLLENNPKEKALLQDLLNQINRIIKNA